jgi:hypothetical protein
MAEEDKQEIQEEATNRSLLARFDGLQVDGLIRRYRRHVAIVVVLALGIWAAQMGLDRLPITATEVPEETEQAATATPAGEPLTLADLPAYEQADSSSIGVQRKLDIHTIIPSRPRLEVIEYTVEKGDSLFGIADRYGLKPETILWGNFEYFYGMRAN